MSAFACLVCGADADVRTFYCAPCAAAGRRMRPTEPERPLVRMTCPACGGSSPAYGDADAAACLHCHAVVDLVARVAVS